MILFCYHSPTCIKDALQEVQNWAGCGMPRHNASGEQKHLIQVKQGQKSTILLGQNQLLPKIKGTCVLVSGKAILNRHSANPYCTRLAGLKLLDCSFLLLSNIMQSFCNCSNEGSSLPTSIFRKHESHITLGCQLLHGFPQDRRKTEREGREEQNILAAAFWSEIFVFTYKQGTITSATAFFCFFSYSSKIQISVHNQILIFISPLAFCSTWCPHPQRSWRRFSSPNSKVNASISRPCSQNTNPTPKTQDSFPCGRLRYCRNLPKHW